LYNTTPVQELTPSASVLQKAILEFDNGTVPTYVRSPETLGVASAPKGETEISLSGASA
jgi:hypothetical protein